MSRRAPGVVAVVALAAILALVFLADGDSSGAVEAGGEGLGFGVPCRYVKTAEMDPIKYPGDSPPSPSHAHDFFGADPLTASSTNFSIRKNATTKCNFAGERKGEDFSAYWVPHPGQSGVEALISKAYYKPMPITDSSRRYSPYPANLKIISGEDVWWTCGGNPDHKSAPPRTRAPHDCPETHPYIMTDVRFPDCLKRVSDLPTNETHIGVYANPKTGDCPRGYTKVLQLRLHVLYNTSRASNMQQFSSGDYTSYHADFMSGWNRISSDKPTEFDRLLEQCVYDGVGCGQVGE